MNRSGFIKRIICSLLIFYSFSLFSQTDIVIGNTVVQTDTIYTGLDIPWEMVYGPDDFLWITERKGLVSRIDPITKTKTIILDLTANAFSFTYGECGLLGMALHPDFPATPEVFLVYNYGIISDLKERVVKYTYISGQLLNQQILIDSIKGGTGHDGSRLLFLPDKTLLMTTGEAQNGALAQDLTKLNGKTLRLNPDGTIPADNPFPNSYIYTYGHRNAQGLTLGPGNIIYSSEHGPANDDEFQIIEKGRNYGWPDVEGFCDLPAEAAYCSAHNIKEPMLNWTPTIAPGDLAWYSNPAFPELDQHMLLATLKAKKLVAIKLDANGTSVVSQSSHFENMFGRLRAVSIGPQKEIYLATNGLPQENTTPNTHNIVVLKGFLPVSIKKYSMDEGLKVYPAIVENWLNVESASPENLTLKLKDLSARICFESSIHKGLQKIAINSLADGLYCAIIELEGKIIYQAKIIKQ